MSATVIIKLLKILLNFDLFIKIFYKQINQSILIFIVNSYARNLNKTVQ